MYLAANQGSTGEHPQTTGERVADGAVHAIGLVVIALGGGALIPAALRHSSGENAFAMALYIACAILMLSCSAVYNLASPLRARRVLCWLDGTAIFVMIAGSYTPLFLNLLPAGLGIASAAVVWLLAIAGSFIRALLPGWSDRSWSALYGGYAAIPMIIIAPSALHLPFLSLGLIGASCLVYGLGVRIFLDDAAPYRRAIWHALVACGASIHCGALATGFILPSS